VKADAIDGRAHATRSAPPRFNQRSNDMPSGNQGQGQGRRGDGSQGRSNGGASREARPPRTDFTERAEDLAAQAREQFDAAGEEVARGYRRAEGLVARNPAPSVLLSFGLGFGFGLALTALLTQREETWAERYLPDRVRGFPDAARRFGRQAPAAIQETGIADAFHHLTDSIREIPSAVARLIPGR
jgi:hypothetical protein